MRKWLLVAASAALLAGCNNATSTSASDAPAPAAAEQTAAEPSLTPQEEANKQVVVDFMGAMALQDVDKAASYLKDDYIQHNPNVPTGKQGYVDFFKMIWPNGPKPGPAPELPLVLVQGDYVTTMMVRPQPEPDDASKTYDSYWFDIFRLENGMIAEHWDGALKQKR